MGLRVVDDDSDEFAAWDDDGPGEFDADDGDDDPTMPCPHCERPVFDDAEQCPHCGRYLSREDAPFRRPWWLWVGFFLCLYAIYHWIF